jgi:hypothetical protein
MSDITGVTQYSAADTEYKELRQIFDYLRSCGIVGPSLAGQRAQSPASVHDVAQQEADICIVDAEDLLEYPAQIVQQYCATTGLNYSGQCMLRWETPGESLRARDAFATWTGFHEEAINSTGLKQSSKVCLNQNRFIVFLVNNFRRRSERGMLQNKTRNGARNLECPVRS